MVDNLEEVKTMSKTNRRRFMTSALAATGAVAAGLHRAQSQNTLAPGGAVPLPDGAKPAPRVQKLSAVSQVPLGNSGLTISMVGIGTGTVGVRRSSNQTRLGDEGFQRLMRHALDNGITFFDLADGYGSNPFFGRAMKGIARDKYVIQTKTFSRTPEKAREDIDRFLQELQTDYIDSLIVHCVTEGDWPTRFAGVLDVFTEAKKAGKIRAHGVTCHSYPALQAALASDWVQLNQVRWNAYRSHMDNDVETVRSLFTQMRAKGQGMISMKVMGEGRLVKGPNAKTPEELLRFQVESGVVDAFVVGVESTEQIDQLIRHTQSALNELGYVPSPVRAI
jgi:1-deoxyxylulose-5-phosphate synthase